MYLHGGRGGVTATENKALEGLLGTALASCMEWKASERCWEGFVLSAQSFGCFQV